MSSENLFITQNGYNVYKLFLMCIFFYNFYTKRVYIKCETKKNHTGYQKLAMACKIWAALALTNKLFFAGLEGSLLQKIELSCVKLPANDLLYL